MIPVAITVEGFLSYRARQTACFEGHALWMLAGANGSGKSSLFDAITYALFGEHRAGSRHADQLVNKDSDKLLVEFTFKLDDGQTYRAHRTLTRERGRKTCCIRQKIGEDQWLEVENTSSVGDFKEWVVQHVGVDYTTFVLSVMLLQGKSNEILEKTPAHRHEALGQIVGLERYKELHRRADAERKKYREKETNTKAKLDGCTPVKESQIQTTQDDQQRAQSEIDKLDAARKATTDLLGDAGRWESLQGQLKEKQQELQNVKQATRDASAIREQFSELQQLQVSLPVLTEWKSAWHQQGNRLVEQRQLRGSIDDEDERIKQLDHDLSDCRSAIEERKKTEKRLTGELKALAEKLSHWRSDEPWLKQFTDYRESSRTAQREIDKQQSMLREREEAMRKHAGCETTLDEVATVSKSHDAASEESARARVQLEHVQESLNRFNQLEHASNCPHCGQELGPEHLAKETDRLLGLLAEATSVAERKELAAAVQSKALADVKERREEWKAKHDKINKGIESAKDELDRQKENRSRAERSCSTAAERLSEALKSKIGPPPHGIWALTGFPEETEFETLTLEHRTGSEKQSQLQQQLKELQAAIERTRQKQGELERERTKTDQATASQKLKIAGVEAELQQHTANAKKQWEKLPADWQSWEPDFATAQIKDLSARTEELERLDLQARFDQMKTAEDRQEQLSKEVEDYRREIAAIHPSACRTADAVTAELTQIEAELSKVKQQHQKLCDTLSSLRKQHAEFEEAEEAYKQAARLHHLWKTVAKHLSRDGLQRALVRKAEEQITRYANATLDRLSAGEMSMELQPPGENNGSETALDLAVRSSTSQQPLSVAFLSGSQKFRVSVALSLAIGQYASRHSRPVQAVVIDEGFGCLDTENRQVMISEIQSLQDQLQRIILVSHQEEFTDAFKHGYQVKLNGQGGSELTEFHR